MRVAEKIYKQMLLKGLNQQRLARMSAISDSEISRILRGKSSPSLEYAFRLCRALGVSLDYLADDALEVDPSQETEPESALETEVLSLARELRPRAARRLLETAVELGYDVAIRRLLGLDIKPLVELGETARGASGIAGPSANAGRANSA